MSSFTTRHIAKHFYIKLTRTLNEISQLSQNLKLTLLKRRSSPSGKPAHFELAFISEKERGRGDTGLINDVCEAQIVRERYFDVFEIEPECPGMNGNEIELIPISLALVLSIT